MTLETQAQDARERGLLSTYYATARDIPPTPEESNRVVDFSPYQSINIPSLPPVWIPPPQPMPYNHLRQPQQQQTFNNSYQPRSDLAQGQSSFRPRNGGASSTAPQHQSGSSSAYRPRASSAPAGPTPIPEALPRRASTPSASGPPAPKPKQWLPPSGNPQPLPDRAGTNHTWSRQARPRKSALLNPLSAQQVTANLTHAANAPPYDYSRFKDEDEGFESNSSGPPSQAKGGSSKQ
jgi:hypothetical protein